MPKRISFSILTNSGSGEAQFSITFIIIWNIIGDTPGSFCRKTFFSEIGLPMHTFQLSAWKANTAGMGTSDSSSLSPDFLESVTGGSWRKSPDSTSFEKLANALVTS